MLRITFINVGYGDSILLEELKDSKRIFTMLVDGGSPFEGEYRRAYEVHPDRCPPSKYLIQHGIERLDVIFLTHFHIDHVGGIPDVMREIPFGEVWANYHLPMPLPERIRTSGLLIHPESIEMHRSLELLQEMEKLANIVGHDITPILKHRFEENLTGNLIADLYAVKPDLAKNTELLVKQVCNSRAYGVESALYTLDKTQNASCAALRISYRGRSALLAADLPHSYWNSLIDKGYSIHADILKFPHHGHEDGTSLKFTGNVDPSHVVFCVSADNPFGCPKPSVFSTFKENVRFHATGEIYMPPALELLSPHTAVVCEIADDSSLQWGIETTASDNAIMFYQE